MSDENEQDPDTVTTWLRKRQDLTDSLEQDGYSYYKYLQRSQVYGALGYPDLAAMDAYKAVLLSDALLDTSDEYHEDAVASMRSDETPSTAAMRTSEDEDEIDEVEGQRRSQIALTALAYHLTTLGCLQSAFDFIKRAMAIEADNVRIIAVNDRFVERVEAYSISRGSDTDPRDIKRSSLPDRGFVRRQVYPWNLHEAERHADAAIELLNHAMAAVAPDLEVRLTELPALSSTSESTVVQLGVFAKRDLQPGERVLNERSLLTASSVLHDLICDACSSALDDPNINELVKCQDCDNAVFCSQTCYQLAQDKYHPSVCGMGAEALAKDRPAAEAVDSLYTLLLLRAMAMSQTQDIHPLDMTEVKYIWGDFEVEGELPQPVPPANSSTAEALERGAEIYEASSKTLPFAFDANVLVPLNMLEKMDIRIFDASHNLAEAWLYNTLYAKFRGTASARQNPRSGRPEVAAVHPLWCLANHSCDPNVQWQWAGNIDFTVRADRVAWQRRSKSGEETLGRPSMPGGIERGDEILNHYIDIDLSVQERRLWGAGVLGGFCRCSRCKWEASEEPPPVEI